MPDSIAVNCDARHTADDIERQHKQELNKLQKRLRRNAGRAIADFSMIEAVDKVMCCLTDFAKRLENSDQDQPMVFPRLDQFDERLYPLQPAMQTSND